MDQSTWATCARSLSRLLVLVLIVSAWTVFAQEKKGSNREASRSLYRSWLTDDARYLITEGERRAFLALKTDEEREQFIEQFWLRRDPDPDTEVNEFREEHYQRIAYANEHFSSGIPGWKTDRGRMYIKFGKPDQIQSHPAGGSYHRPFYEGGGTTSTYPFEIWWYRYLEGVGSDVEIEFVDPTGSGEYRIARSPDEKDALLYTPGAGQTLAEQLFGVPRSERISGRTQPMRMQDSQFERLTRLANLERAPRVKYPETARLALGESEDPRVVIEALPVSLRVDFLRVTENSVIASFTVQLENEDLVYRDVGGLQTATANIFGRVTNVAGRRLGQFEDVVRSSYPAELPTSGLRSRSVYRRDLVLAPGNYKLDLAVRDTGSGKAGVIHPAFVVPRYPEGELATSTLILASRLEPLGDHPAAEKFAYGALKVLPNVNGVFRANQSLGVYLQVYNVAVDQATLRPRLEVAYLITRQGRELARVKEDGRNGLSRLGGPQVTLGRLIPLKELNPGFYDLTVEITDQVAGRTVRRKEPFQIVE